MGTRKRLLTGSGQTGKQKRENGSGRNRILKMWQELRNRLGLGTTGLNRHTGPGWRRFQRINDRTSLSLPTFVQITYSRLQSEKS